MTSTIQIDTATVTVDGIDVGLRRIGVDEYLVIVGNGISYPVAGYSSALEAAEDLAEEYRKVGGQSSLATAYLAAVQDFVNAKREAYEKEIKPSLLARFFGTS